jgi:1-acyl-sn-glycerol-3-phosphate acyltransferase
MAKSLARQVLSAEDYERLIRLEFRDAGHGFDRFGMHPAFVALSVGLVRPWYEKYFRVRSYGVENIPERGACILAANHSGTLPIDGAMLWADVVRKADPTRVPRAVADHFVAALPYVSTLFARAGVVGGSRGNVRRLLQDGELLMIFPEGVPGITKTFDKRYQLQAWRVGHAELAIRHGAKVVPVGIVGPEEQMPAIAVIRGVKILGFPVLPIVLTPFPLPVRYHIHYGEALDFQQRYAPTDANDPDAVAEAADEVRRAVQALLDHGRAARPGVFA